MTDSIATCLKDARRRLAGAGLADAEQEARLLLAHVLDMKPLDLYLAADRLLSSGQARRFEGMIARRLTREPVSQILGEREFWGLAFRVTRDVLTPRPDSETLVEAALGEIGARGTGGRGTSDRQTGPLRILDLGTGSGCLLLSLLHELPQATGLGVDISPAALGVARDNARRLGLAARAEFLCSDWTAALAETHCFDVILSNPPYIGLGEKDGLMPEVRDHEPETALFAGPEGLDAYDRLLREVPAFLRPGGIVILEIGAAQAAAVSARARTAGAASCRIFRDLGGRDRCVRLEF